jgi:UDP-N-acetyl-alpha-D-muramoyl-L-alanyl-L-glutamate epimerase
MTGQSAPFDPTAITAFRFTHRAIDEDGRVRLGYALDDIAFVETIDVPIARPLGADAAAAAEPLLALLHWCAGVSYYKAAVPDSIACETGVPGPMTAAYLDAIYSEGLGEFAYTNALRHVPRPRFPTSATVATNPTPARTPPQRVLVPIGGGKDSIVGLEVMRRTGCEVSLFSVGTARALHDTAAVARLPHLVARRALDPRLLELNATGAYNGHVPITAVVSAIALLTAALNGFDGVAMSNERSASHGNVVWDGIEINHQFSKSLQAERLQRAALAELEPRLQVFSVLRPASELAIARGFAQLDAYHHAFTSCNAIFRTDPSRRLSSWCCECPKCRFVFLALAPFMEPARLRGIFGRDLLDEPHQFGGFALLAATGGHKPFECVGEEQEALSAIAMLAEDVRWSERPVVRRLADEVLRPAVAVPPPDWWSALSDDHEVPAPFLPALHAVLGA